MFVYIGFVKKIITVYDEVLYCSGPYSEKGEQPMKLEDLIKFLKSQGLTSEQIYEIYAFIKAKYCKN